MPNAGTANLQWLGAATLVVLCAAGTAFAQPKTNADYCDSDGANLVLAIDTTTPYDEKDKDLLVRGRSGYRDDAWWRPPGDAHDHKLLRQQ